MSVALAQFGYGTEWTDIRVDGYEGYLPQMTDYHMHDYYEISLIFSGKVNVLLSDMVDAGTHARLVLMRPHTPHYIYCEPELIYRRRNLTFSPHFLADFLPEMQKMMGIFGKNGMILRLNEAKTEQFLAIFEQIRQEKSIFRQKMLLLYFLSLVQDLMPQEGSAERIPGFITEALTFISAHSAEHIVAQEIADQLGVSRTTLMTAFKKYAGITVNEYLTRCRIKDAVALLRQGKTEQETAETCGFTDACNLIRAFKRVFGLTPKQYLSKT